MLDRKEELEKFKIDIDLRRYAETVGYIISQKESSRNSSVLTHPNGDKIIVAIDSDHHWIYFSVRNDLDNGSIIDFIQNRDGSSLGSIRKTLRNFLQLPHPTPNLSSNFTQLSPASKDILKVKLDLQKMNPLNEKFPYLEDRGIPYWALSHKRFLGKILIDFKGNTIFPHNNLNGLCGYEIKNFNFTGFSPGGEKGLWSSKVFPNDTSLVITESAIDALSYFATHKNLTQRFISFSGSFNPNQLTLIQMACMKFEKNPTVVMAFDNDKAGDNFCIQISKAISASGRKIEVIEDRPKTGGMDWNDVLKAQCSDV